MSTAPRSAPRKSRPHLLPAPLLDDPTARSLRRVGVIDVGSNSIRIVIFDGAARSPAYFYNEKVMAGLGQGLAATGRLNPVGVERGLAALKRFAVLAKSMRVTPLICIATAAVRDASDGPAFRQQVEKETGLKLIVVDGHEEARLSAQGVLLGWPAARGLVCDMGGSSMELAVIADGRVGRRASSPLGPFRMQQVAGGAQGRAEHLRGIMAGLVKAVGTRHGPIYLVGGSWRAIARLDMERRGYPMKVLHEYRMTPEDVSATAEWIASHSIKEMRAATGISADRLELVPLAAEVLCHLAERFTPEEFAISAYGIREGMLYEQMAPSLRRRDPLIEAARFAEKQMARMPGFGKHLYRFLYPLFAEAPRARMRLILTACLLHDTTWRAHPDYRAEACFDNVTHANMAALSHVERIFLGLALLHRYKSSRRDSRMEVLAGLLDTDEIRDAEILGKAMRFGAMFAVRDPNSAGTLEPDDGVLRLRMTTKGRALMGEVATARFESLCAALGVTAEVV